MGGKIYRVWCEDGPRHEGLSGEGLVSLVRAGEVDLDDRIALQGSEQWSRAWEVDGLFEPCVVHALRQHRDAVDRMHRSIRGGWLTVIEYRRQRDDMLLREPEVPDSSWSRRSRPDLTRAGAEEALIRAAAEGAASSRAARKPPRPAAPTVNPAAMTGSFLAVRENVTQMLRGDLPGWAEPQVWLDEIRRHGLGVALRIGLLALLLDPLEPIVHAQQWLLAICAITAAGGMILQLTLPPTSHGGVRRAVRMLVACATVSAVFMVGKSVDVKHGLVGHHWPAMAGWQDQWTAWLQETMQRLGWASAGTTAA